MRGLHPQPGLDIYAGLPIGQRSWESNAAALALAATMASGLGLPGGPHGLADHPENDGHIRTTGHYPGSQYVELSEHVAGHPAESDSYIDPSSLGYSQIKIGEGFTFWDYETTHGLEHGTLAALNKGDVSSELHSGQGIWVPNYHEQGRDSDVHPATEAFQEWFGHHGKSWVNERRARTPLPGSAVLVHNPMTGHLSVGKVVRTKVSGPGDRVIEVDLGTHKVISQMDNPAFVAFGRQTHKPADQHTGANPAPEAHTSTAHTGQANIPGVDASRPVHSDIPGPDYNPGGNHRTTDHQSKHPSPESQRGSGELQIRKRIVTTALQLYKEHGGRGEWPALEKFIGDYSYQKWCSDLDSLVAKLAGVPFSDGQRAGGQDIVRVANLPSSPYLRGDTLQQWFEQHGEYWDNSPGSKMPEPGDFVFFNVDGTLSHTGVIVATQGRSLTVIAGDDGPDLTLNMYPVDVDNPATGVAAYGSMFGSGQHTTVVGHHSSHPSHRYGALAAIPGLLSIGQATHTTKRQNTHPGQHSHHPTSHRPGAAIPGLPAYSTHPGSRAKKHPSSHGHVPQPETGTVTGEYTIDTPVEGTNSGLTAAQINQLLAGRGDLQGLGDEFIRMQNEYGVNALWGVAQAIHEVGWSGHSEIADTDNNLFGINADDSDPGGDASHYTSPAACVEYWGWYITHYYLNPDNHQYYNGNSARGIATTYASDPKYAKKVVDIMNILLGMVKNSPQPSTQPSTPTRPPPRPTHSSLPPSSRHPGGRHNHIGSYSPGSAVIPGLVQVQNPAPGSYQV